MLVKAFNLQFHIKKKSVKVSFFPCVKKVKLFDTTNITEVINDFSPNVAAGASSPGSPGIDPELLSDCSQSEPETRAQIWLSVCLGPRYYIDILSYDRWSHCVDSKVRGHAHSLIIVK